MLAVNLCFAQWLKLRYFLPSSVSAIITSTGAANHSNSLKFKEGSESWGLLHKSDLLGSAQVVLNPLRSIYLPNY